MNDAEELRECKDMLVLQLNAMETMLKSIKRMVKISKIELNTSIVEMDIVDLYTSIESCRPTEFEPKDK